MDFLRKQGGLYVNENETFATDENIDGMAKMMQLMKMLNDNQALEKENEDKNDVDIRYFDDKLQSQEIRILKSAIPFFDIRQQKSLAMFVKIMEMKKVLEYYDSAEVKTAEIPSYNDPDQEKLWKKRMLMAIRPHLERDQRHMTDMLIKYIDIKEAMENT